MYILVTSEHKISLLAQKHVQYDQLCCAICCVFGERENYELIKI